MTTLTPSSIIISNVDINSGTLASVQPANDFSVQFRSPIYLKENSRVSIKSVQFESAQEIVIDDTCNELELYMAGAGAWFPQIGIAYPGNATNTVQLTNGTYTLETLCEHITNAVVAHCVTIDPTWTDHWGFRCYFGAKGFIWFEFARVDSGDYTDLATIQLWTEQPALANILGLALSPGGQQSQLHELADATGAYQNIVADYQPYLNRSATGYSPCVLLELQNLRIKSLNSYIRGNVNIMAKIPLYSAPAEPYVQYEPAETIYFKTQETSLTELRFRLLNLDMSLHGVTGQKPTIIVMEIQPPE
jgi:hypothetical protein